MGYIILTIMVMVGYGHQVEEAVIYVAYFKIICAMGVQRHNKGSALFHINFLDVFQKSVILKNAFSGRW